MRVSRRGLLAGAGALALAGCSRFGGDGASTGGSPTDGSSPTGDESPTGTATGGADGDAGTPTGPETVRFQSTAGSSIVGTLYGAGDCGVVLVPQRNLDRDSWRPQAERLASDDVAVLAIDEDPNARPASALGAARYLRKERAVQRLVLVGASSGGEAVVRANARSDEGAVDGVVAISAGGGADVAGDLQGRKLFVVSEGDDDRFVRVARDLHRNASGPKELVEYDGDAHGQRIFSSPHGEDLASRLETFVTAVCGG